MTTNPELQLYIPWHNHQQTYAAISGAVYYLGYFGGFGNMLPRYQIWKCRKQGILDPKLWGQNMFRSQDFQEKALDAALDKLKDCLVLSTTATQYSQFQSACLLKSRGFKLLEGLCYKHPSYPSAQMNQAHPGQPDGHLHWEHIWYKVLGRPTKIGLCSGVNQMNNCGVDSRGGLKGVQAHDSSPRNKYLTVGWLERGQPFPTGWKRFFSAVDYKLGANFGLVASLGSVVQKCPHNFDLKIFEGWEPDFEKWVPS